MAARVTALACEFHWSEEFILTGLPIARGEQYYHALLRRSRWRTYETAEDSAEQAERLSHAEIPFEPIEGIDEIWRRFEM